MCIFYWATRHRSLEWKILSHQTNHIRGPLLKIWKRFAHTELYVFERRDFEPTIVRDAVNHRPNIVEYAAMMMLGLCRVSAWVEGATSVVTLGALNSNFQKTVIIC